MPTCRRLLITPGLDVEPGRSPANQHVRSPFRCASIRRVPWQLHRRQDIWQIHPCPMGVCSDPTAFYWQQVVILSSTSSQQKNHHDHADSGFRHLFLLRMVLGMMVSGSCELELHRTVNLRPMGGQ